MNSAIEKAKAAIDTKTAVSAAVGVALFGVVTFLAVKSGVKPLKEAASIAKGGK